MFLTINRDKFDLANNTIDVYFEGTIYNKANLAKELHLRENIDDNSLILSLYKTYGVELFGKLDAIFAICIIDKEKKRLYFARDKVGIHPAYIYDNDNTLIVGTKLKEFNKEASFKKEIDFDALASYLSSGYVIQPYSIFKNTKKISPGTFLQYDLLSGKKESFTFWSYESEFDKIRTYTDEKKVITDIEELLYTSIDKRVKVDPNFASTLSGGYDSSLISALLSKTSHKKIDTFTIGFNQSDINEAKDAKKIAKHIGTNHTEHYFTDSDAKDVVPKLCEVFDEPFADYGATPTILMSKLIKNSGFSSMIVGDGGDEVFATADDLSSFARFNKIPQNIRESTYKLLNSLHLNKYNAKYYKLLQVLKSKNIPKLIQARMTLFNKLEIDLLLLENTKPITTFDTIDFSDKIPLVDQITGTYFKTSMIDTELIKSFQTTREAGITLGVPLLDSDIISYMSNIPQELKVKNGEKKYLLKEIAHKYIDKNLLDRPKHGFNIPFSHWMRGELKELVYEQINEKRVKQDQIFNPNTLIKLRDDFYNGDESKKYKLWTIFIFQLWYEYTKEY